MNTHHRKQCHLKQTEDVTRYNWKYPRNLTYISGVNVVTNYILQMHEINSLHSSGLLRSEYSHNLQCNNPEQHRSQYFAAEAQNHPIKHSSMYQEMWGGRGGACWKYDITHRRSRLGHTIWTKSSCCVLILYIHFIIYISLSITM